MTLKTMNNFQGDLPLSPRVLIAILALASFFVWYFCRLTYNVYFHPLRKFPGPKLAAATRWYEAYYELCVGEGGQFMNEIDRIHQQYGPIARIGPNEVHIKDSEYHSTLYSFSGKRNKAPFACDSFGVHLSHVGTEDHDLHRQRRAVLSPFFSKLSVTRFESVVVDKVRKMCQSISMYTGGRELINFRHAFLATTVDMITEYSFGKPAGALDKTNFSPEWDLMICGVSEIVPLARQFSKTIPIAQTIPVEIVRMLNPILAGISDFERLLRSQILQIFTRYNKSRADFCKSSELSSQHSTIFHEILASSTPEEEKSVDRMTQEAVSIVSAASETSSNVLSATMFHVLSNPEVLEKLQAELDTVIPDTSGTVGWRQLEQSPYLTATIQEGLRMTLPVSGRIPVYTDIPLKYGKWTIPPGTYTSMTTRDSHYDPDVYPSPESFKPERWLTDDRDQQKKINMGFVPFGAGSRGCVGMNLAYANLYHSLAAILRRFDMELVDTVFERDVKMTRDHFAGKPSKKSRGVRAKVVKERV